MGSIFSFQQIYLLFGAFILLIYWGFAFTIIYHLTRFGIGVQPKRISAVYFLGTVMLFIFAALLSTTVNVSGLSSRLFDSPQNNNMLQ
ncbi:MAG: hypothetical protein ABI430_02620 [Candidatus Taylorbacteria bacterium]